MTAIPARQARAFLAKPQSNKFGARKAKVDGHTFDSQAEASRYAELRMLEQAGRISGLVVHPKFDLHSRDGAKIGKYIADFSYRCPERGCQVVEDVKSKATRTALYRWKKRHFEAEYRMPITEIMR